MCGIAGFVGLDGEAPASEAVLRAMCATITHRGPDSDGFHFDGPVGLGARRLAIIDLQSGDMPIAGCDPRIVVVQNGEIYNYRALRAELEAKGHRFRSRTDTEVLVHLYEEEGEDLVHRLNGMFAFALWDGIERRLLLARDRLGVKPLHVAIVGRAVAFASELKALLPFPGLDRSLDRAALAAYLAQEYVPAPWSIFAGVGKLRPGELLVTAGGHVRRSQWWSPPFRGSQSPPAKIQPQEAADEIRRLLADAVKIRLMSDVPLGVFLSGGIDSTTIATLASHHTQHLETFSVGFAEPAFDESAQAARVAATLGTEHRTEMLTAGRVLELLPAIGDHFDEPLADPSVVPTFLLSRLARRHVTVALGGDGGDELFFGYSTYRAHKLLAATDWLPTGVRSRLLPGLANGLALLSRKPSRQFLIRRLAKGLPFTPAERHAAWMGTFLPDELAALLVDGADLANEAWAGLRDRLEEPDDLGGTAAAERLDTLLYLPDDLLVKIDRASMASSLEVRVPFLDYRLVEYVVALPHSLRMPGLATKYLLKLAVKDLIPDHVIARKKRGFGIPVASWLRSELRPLAEDLLATDRLRRQGLFQPAAVHELLTEHMQGRRDHRKAVWALVMFQLWADRWMHS